MLAMSLLARLVIAVIAVGAISLGATATPTRAADLTTAQARSYILQKINAKRARFGLPRLILDTRAQEVAQARSDDMAANHYFAHRSNSQLASMFNARGVAWSKIGEILASNDYPTITWSADVAMTGWRHSSTHWSIIKDRAYNCAGVGVAKDGRFGNWIWTVEFVREPSCVTA